MQARKTGRCQPDKTNDVSDFHFPIRNPYVRTKKLPVALLHFTAGFLLVNAWYEARIGHYPAWLASCFIVLAVGEIIFTFFAGRLQRAHPLWGEAMRLITAVTFFVYAVMLFRDRQSLFGTLMVLIALSFVGIFFIEKRWKRPFILRIDEEGLWFPRLFRYELFPWIKFNHVILRNNLLTLDFATNRVVQLDLEVQLGDGETQGFNQFCSRHVAQYGPGARR